MSKASALLKQTDHRPFPAPEKPWKYYQDWKGTLFLHWKVPAEVISAHLPSGLALDTIDGEAWISVVAFTVKNMRPRFLPPFPLISNFHEVNLRTYVVKDGVPGIYFFTVEAGKSISVFLARTLVGLKYKTAKIKRRTNQYVLTKSSERNALHLKYLVLQNITNKADIDTWLTERYCAYEEVNSDLYRFNIHHKPWPLKRVKFRKLKLQYKKWNFGIENCLPDRQYFSPLQEVIFWGREKC